MREKQTLKRRHGFTKQSPRKAIDQRGGGGGPLLDALGDRGKEDHFGGIATEGASLQCVKNIFAEKRRRGE